MRKIHTIEGGYLLIFLLCLMGGNGPAVAQTGGGSASCALNPGHRDFCSTAGCGPCEIGAGDCDINSNCVGSFICGTDNGASFGLPGDFDVCVDSASSCSLDPGHRDFCSTPGCGPCEIGQGDCDTDSDCGGILICGTDNGAGFGLPANFDVCVDASTSSCALSPGHPDYCSTAGCGPCTSGQGDCDISADCAAGLTCGMNNGAGFGLPANFDVCVDASTSSCALSPGHPDYCSTAGCGPCTAGQGDCDGSADCAAGLSCGTNNGAAFGLPSDFDVCVDASTSSCALSPGHRDFCSTPGCGPCTAGQGDCDGSADCAAGLSCGTNNGAAFGLPSDFDVCVAPGGACSLSPGHQAFCTTSGCGPCTAGQGDCDASSECAGTLVCGMNNGATFGLPSDFDVCVAPGGASPGGGNPGGNVTTFSGGSLTDLQALSPNLVFDHLVISGALNLSGTPGKRSLGGGACTGQPGLDGTIKASKITVTGSIRANGGTGSTAVFSGFPNLGCDGGAGGALRLEANTIIFDGATISAQGGNGGPGGGGDGDDGGPGSIDLVATGLIEMSGSSVSTDGRLLLQAGQTNITGSLVFGQLMETIGGGGDTQAPDIQLLSPLPGSGISLGQSLELRIHVQDSGTGVKEVQVTGLGHDQLHSGTELQSNVLTINLPLPSTPPSLDIIARDNEGRERTLTATFTFSGSLVIPPGETFVLDDDLNLGNQSITIGGTLVFEEGANPIITASSLNLQAGGRIEGRGLTGSPPSQGPSLTMNLTESGVIAGIIELTGQAGLTDLGKHHGQGGGNFTLNAKSINISGQVLSEGGNGGTAGSLFVTGGIAGSGGTINLVASQGLTITGKVSANGGISGRDSGKCVVGGAGGKIRLFYSSTANLAGGTFTVQGKGSFNNNDVCTQDLTKFGANGTLTVDYQGLPINGAEPIVNIKEFEPNGLRSIAQGIPVGSPIQLAGTISSGDDSGSTDVLTTTEPIEDLFWVRLETTSDLTVDLVSANSNTDLDLYVVNFNNLSGGGVGATPSGTEKVVLSNLSPGLYLIAVDWSSGSTTNYTLIVNSEN